jgi:hypothetical protein
LFVIEMIDYKIHTDAKITLIPLIAKITPFFFLKKTKKTT